MFHPDYGIFREEKNCRTIETEGRNKSATQELESIDVSEDRMWAKPNGNIKTVMGNLEWSERSSQGTGGRTKPSAILKWGWDINMWEKQLSCCVGQCGGWLIRKCVPLLAGLATSCCGQLISTHYGVKKQMTVLVDYVERRGRQEANRNADFKRWR